MAKRKLTDRLDESPGILDLLILALGVAVFCLAFATLARAHGENGWMAAYQNAYGASCCHERDTVAIPNEDAAGAKIGSQIIAQFPTGPEIVTVNAIHATEDKQGRAMVSKFGCLFKALGG